MNGNPIMKPIIFSELEVKKILNGETLLKREMKGVKDNWIYLDMSDNIGITPIDKNVNDYAKPVDGLYATFEDSEGEIRFPVVKSKYQVGDLLYVKETWCYLCDLDGNDQPLEYTGKYYYCADNLDFPYSDFVRDDGTKKRLSSMEKFNAYA